VPIEEARRHKCARHILYKHVSASSCVTSTKVLVPISISPVVLGALLDYISQQKHQLKGFEKVPFHNQTDSLFLRKNTDDMDRVRDDRGTTSIKAHIHRPILYFSLQKNDVLCTKALTKRWCPRHPKSPKFCLEIFKKRV
jgi:hypothetical protein